MTPSCLRQRCSGSLTANSATASRPSARASRSWAWSRSPTMWTSLKRLLLPALPTVSVLCTRARGDGSAHTVAGAAAWQRSQWPRCRLCIAAFHKATPCCLCGQRVHVRGRAVRSARAMCVQDQGACVRAAARGRGRAKARREALRLLPVTRLSVAWPAGRCGFCCCGFCCCGCCCWPLQMRSLECSHGCRWPTRRCRARSPSTRTRARRGKLPPTPASPSPWLPSRPVYMLSALLGASAGRAHGFRAVSTVGAHQVVGGDLRRPPHAPNRHSSAGAPADPLCVYGALIPVPPRPALI